MHQSQSINWFFSASAAAAVFSALLEASPCLFRVILWVTPRLATLRQLQRFIPRRRPTASERRSFGLFVCLLLQNLNANML